MKKKLFNNNPPSCVYCHKAEVMNNTLVCTAKKNIAATTPCGKYLYDPFKRIPLQQNVAGAYNAKDFSL